MDKLGREPALLKRGPRDGDLVHISAGELVILVPGEALDVMIAESENLDDDIEVHRYVFIGYNRDRMPVFIHDRRLG